MSKLLNMTGLTHFWGKVKTYIDNGLSAKVDAVTGKGLSTNDLTAALKGNYDAAYTHSQNADVHVTAAEKQAWDAKSNFSGAYGDLTGKPTIPSTVAELSDSGNYALKTDITAIETITTAEIDALFT